MAKYETVIGLEFHAELKTATKLFCSCPTTFTGDPNTNICPVCLGFPGALPVLNSKAVELAVKAGLALNCEISHYSKFDRKNYFYPDLPPAYQITQFYLPICKNGWLEIGSGKNRKKIRINRIHIEADAGKLVHSGDTITNSHYSLADYNRSAMPLIEIVTEPDISSSQEAYEFAQLLKLTLEYADVSDVKMEQGSLRCDVNISLRPEGQEKFGTRREIKNLNSFKAMLRAIKHEEIAQGEILDEGGEIFQETLTWDDNNGRTISMRSKENAHDYRYFPEPDLMPIVLEQSWIDALGEELPQMPNRRLKRLVEECGLSEYDAGIIVASPALAHFFDAAILHYEDGESVAKWLLGDISRILNAQKSSEEEEIKVIPIPPEDLAKLLNAIKSGEINNNTAKTVLEEMFISGKGPEEIIEEKGFKQISDTGALAKAVKDIIAANPKPVEDYKNGKKQSLGFLVGQVMKATGGQANPPMVRDLLCQALDKE